MRVKQIISRKPCELSGQLAKLQAIEPDLLGCSTAGEITQKGVEDGTSTLTALHFDKVQLIQADTRLAGMDDSYGEISPFTLGASCKLHNQTMTVTNLGEV